jgi:hypothetical protein
MKDAILEQFRAIVKAQSSDGLALVTDPENNPICSIRADQDARCIFVEWKQYATSAQLRFIHEHIIDLLKRHQIAKVLGDDTALPTIHCDDQKWIVENWLPRAKAAGLKMAANKIPATHFGKVAVESVRLFLSRGILIRAFDNIADARNWLRTQE